MSTEVDALKAQVTATVALEQQLIAAYQGALSQAVTLSSQIHDLTVQLANTTDPTMVTMLIAQLKATADQMRAVLPVVPTA